MAKLNTWNSITQGDVISLSDEQTITSMMENDGLKGRVSLDCKVEDVRWFHTTCGVSYCLIILDKDDLTVVIKRIEEVYDLHVCFNPGFEANSKSELDAEWLFNEDEYVGVFDQNNVAFEKKFDLWGQTQGELGGVLEYHASEPHENPLVFVFEYGEGEFVQLYQGVQVNDNEVRLNFLGD